MLLVADESSVIAVTVGIEVLAFSGSLAIDIVSAVLVAVGVDSMSVPIVVSGGIANFSVFIGELIGRASLFFSHLY